MYLVRSLSPLTAIVSWLLTISLLTLLETTGATSPAWRLTGWTNAPLIAISVYSMAEKLLARFAYFWRDRRQEADPAQTGSDTSTNPDQGESTDVS
jgi:hypothetical protein